MLNAILSRWVRQHAARQILGDSTIPSAPPAEATRQGDASLLQSILRWLPGEADPWGAHAKPALKTALLPQLRAEFTACLRGLGEVEELRSSIQRARCLRDFWHLRSWLYTEVARRFDQAEAEARLARLSPHFPGCPAAPSSLPPSAKRH